MATYAYQRLSTSEQLKGTGKERQEDGVAAFCQRHGLEAVSRVYSDYGKSGDGTHLDEGELGQFIKDVEANRVKAGSVLVVDNLDRLSRLQPLRAMHLFTGLLLKGISIGVEAENRIYTEGDVPELIQASVTFGRSSGENATKKRMLGIAWTKAREGMKDGQRLDSRPPAWLDRVHGKGGRDYLIEGFKPNRERVAVVKLIYRLAKSMSIENIARKLNADGVEPMGNLKWVEEDGQKVCTGKVNPWNAGYVRKILTTRAVLGEFTPHKGSLRSKAKRQARTALATIKDYFPRIIEQAEFDAVQAVLTKRRSYTGPKAKGSPANLFTKLVFDAWDGTSMSISQKKSGNVDKMMVSYAANCGVEGSRRMSIRYRDVEEALLNSLHELKASDVVGDSAGNELETAQERMSAVEGELAILRTRQKKREAEKKPLSETLFDSIEALETEQFELTTKIAELKSRTAGDQVDALTETQTLVKLIRNEAALKKAGTTMVEARDRLRYRISNLVKSVYLYTIQHGERYHSRWPQKWCMGLCTLNSGKSFDFFIKQKAWVVSNLGRAEPFEIAFDIRNLPTDNAKRMKQIDDDLIDVFEVLDEEMAEHAK